MSTTLTRWRENAFAPFEWAGLLPVLVQDIRVEQYVDEEHCVVRAELPGFNPEKEIEVSVLDGVLTIAAQRTEAKREKLHSEFHYGRFERSVALPDGAIEKSTTPCYADGVIEITLTLGETRASGRRIPIETVRHPASPPATHPVTHPPVTRPAVARPSPVGSAPVGSPPMTSPPIGPPPIRPSVVRPAAKTSTVRHRPAAT
jgi:HSP20 family molecular chaperone IbpA